jgi:hypothetical protein
MERVVQMAKVLVHYPKKKHLERMAWFLSVEIEPAIAFISLSRNVGTARMPALSGLKSQN